MTAAPAGAAEDAEGVGAGVNMSVSAGAGGGAGVSGAKRRALELEATEEWDGLRAEADAAAAPRIRWAAGGTEGRTPEKWDCEERNGKKAGSELSCS